MHEMKEHDASTCPGWRLSMSGALEGYTECGHDRFDPGSAVHDKAQAFFHGQPSKHEPHEECPGCPGYALFEPIGSSRNYTRFWIERDDNCNVFPSDDEAIEAAVAACRAAGFVVRRELAREG